jgi:hypothetical protein
MQNDSLQVLQKIAENLSQGIIHGIQNINHKQEIIQGLDNATTSTLITTIVGAALTYFIRHFDKKRILRKVMASLTENDKH